MLRYTLNRIIIAIPVLFGVLTVTFFLIRLIPGDPCTAQLGEKATEVICAKFNADKGLDKPIIVQFGVYLRDIFQGDLGKSIRLNRPITQLIAERLPTTVELGVAALIIAISVGVPLGIVAALRRNSLIDVLTMVGSNIGVSMPIFWLGLMLAYIFALVLKDTPFQLPPSGRLPSGVTNIPFYQVWGWDVDLKTGYGQLLQFFGNLYIPNSLITMQWAAFWATLRHLILPAMALATIPMAIIARMTRSAMLEVLGRDYVRTARAKGLADQVVIMRHAFRNALMPVVTIVGLQLGTIFGGAVLTETIFNLAGVGRILFDAITTRDYPIIQGFTLAIAFGYVLVNLLVDLSYGWLDPRIRY
ncbi:ABC transporter permease [Candidatus Oscillochloris fontis]|uniref:ABC transporter permease n=1 Tax=Candidatus Oscillochloris fontis TaxID=2496868 RepID=UPI00101CC77C|nr:ABC transporter permease [Candidatus Oscillochloris fontis]